MSQEQNAHLVGTDNRLRLSSNSDEAVNWSAGHYSTDARGLRNAASYSGDSRAVPYLGPPQRFRNSESAAPTDRYNYTPLPLQSDCGLSQHQSSLLSMRMNTVESPIETLLVRLEWVSQVPAGHQVCYDNMTFVKRNTVKAALQRWMSSENRSDNFQKLNADVESAFSILPQSGVIRSSDRYARYFLQALARLWYAIPKLCQTYNEDQAIQTKLGILQRKIYDVLRSYGCPPTPELMEDELMHSTPQPLSAFSGIEEDDYPNREERLIQSGPSRNIRQGPRTISSSSAEPPHHTLSANALQTQSDARSSSAEPLQHTLGANVVQTQTDSTNPSIFGKKSKKRQNAANEDPSNV